MGEKEDYLTSYRVFFENFAATVNPEDQLPVNIAGYTITEAELTGEVLYWTTQYLTEKQCPLTLMTPLRWIILEEVRVASKNCPNEFGFQSDVSVYIALRLMQAVTARVNDVCLRYLDNSRLDSLPPPPTQRDLKTVSCATKNSRRVMEDRHVEVGNLEALFGIDTTEPTSFYAVYDGHAGSAAATYCAAHLHQYLVESPYFTTDLRKAMRDAFLRTDTDFIRKSNQKRACGGSTAVAVTVRGRKLLAAWAGDSLALLAKRMRLMQLVRPHKPSREDERDRIESSGGSVMYWGTWRVNGQLAVSRAIGDAQYKPYVTARPEIATVDLDGDEDFVVVACDGLWDFVSEDDVALAVYRQLAADPDDLKAVTKRLVVQAKRQGSADNISIIVVFLKDPRDIAADNRPPMDLGLDNALANAPPFAGETEACKRQAEASALTADAEADTEADAEVADNGVDNSDSDSEDLGPETAVDADDIDADRNHEPAPPTPPAHTVEAGHVDGPLVDNVAESGDDSEDEWNYFKGEGEREEQNPTEEQDELPRSETPGQDNSAWETSSVDMNSSPLNPDAPVFIPGSVAGSDVVLAESPRKPMPMDDIELPDVAQFETGAVVRPAELLDLDNCDQLNGHHNVSIDEAVKEHLNGNEKCTMDSLGFGFNVGIEPDKVKESGFIQDFERIQKDTTDFCNVQVFQTHSETNPFAVEGDDELFERLKNKERDPMSMSFYQEKDDDTCERLPKNEPHVDLNAVQPLPDSDDEDIQPNGICDNDKENVAPGHSDPFQSNLEPNNDIMRLEDRTETLAQNLSNFGQGDNCMEYMVAGSNNIGYPNIEIETNIPQDAVQQTDTPESHKLMFEQIPEIPDGKSSELGFINDDNQDPSESERDRAITPQDETSHDIEMESKLDDSPLEELQPLQDDRADSERVLTPASIQLDEKESEVAEPVCELVAEPSVDFLAASPAPVDDGTEEAITPEPTPAITDVAVDVHRNEVDDVAATLDDTGIECGDMEPSEIEDEQVEAELAAVASPLPARSPVPLDTVVSPLPAHSPLPSEPIPSPAPLESPAPAASPAPVAASPGLIAASPKPIAASPEPVAESPAPVAASPLDTIAQSVSPAPSASPAPQEMLLPEVSNPCESPLPARSLPEIAVETQRDSPAPAETSVSPVPSEAQQEEVQAPVAVECPTSIETLVSAEPEQSESPLPARSPAVGEPIEAAVEAICAPAAEPAPSPLPADVPLPGESPAPPASPAPRALTPLEAHTELATEAISEPERPAEVESDRPPSEAQIADAQEARETQAAVVAEEAPLAAARGASPCGAPPDLVTDVDVGVPESRAQEICVPVTQEIRAEDGEQRAPAPPGAPTSDPALTAAAVGAAAVAAAAVAATKSKTPAKKSSTTPTAKTDARTPKSITKTTPRAPLSATKRPTSTTAAPRTSTSAPRPAPARSASASKPATVGAAKPAAAATKPPAARAPSSKPAAPARPATSTLKSVAKAPTTAAPPRAAPAPRPAPSTRAPAPARPATARPAPAKSTAAPASRAAPRPAPARPATAAPTAAKLTARKLPEKKPLTNGDVKETKPAPRPPPITRPTGPRPAPRVPAAPPAPAAPKAASRAPAPRAPLDKQSKDLANKRITAKAAPPRTAVTKAAVGPKCVTKLGPKKATEISATNGLPNGSPAKAPPSPPADNALLPDVIA